MKIKMYMASNFIYLLFNGYWLISRLNLEQVILHVKTEFVYQQLLAREVHPLCNLEITISENQFKVAS